MDKEKLQIAARKLQIGRPGKHIFLCAGSDKSKCCSQEDGLASWDYLKKRIKAIHLEDQVHIWRTKANCLRVCCQGPIVVIYPEGIWYHSCNPSVLDRILQEHILGGRIVQEFQILPSRDV